MVRQNRHPCIPLSLRNEESLKTFISHRSDIWPPDAGAPLGRGGRQRLGRHLRGLVQLGLEREEDGEELLLVADEDGVGHEGQLGLDGVLDGDGSDVLAARGDQQFLNAAWKDFSGVLFSLSRDICGGTVELQSLLTVPISVCVFLPNKRHNAFHLLYPNFIRPKGE